MTKASWLDGVTCWVMRKRAAVYWPIGSSGLARRWSQFIPAWCHCREVFLSVPRGTLLFYFLFLRLHFCFLGFKTCKKHKFYLVVLQPGCLTQTPRAMTGGNVA